MSLRRLVPALVLAALVALGAHRAIAGFGPAQGASQGPAAAGKPWITWTGAQGIATASNFATFTTRNNHSALAYDPSSDEAAIFEGALSDSYSSGSNLSIKLYWTTGGTATTGAVVWTVEVETLDPWTLDLDADSFDAAQSATTTTAGTAGVLATTTYALANADVDAIAAGAPFRLRVTRDANNGSDTLSEDAYLIRVTVGQ